MSSKVHERLSDIARWSGQIPQSVLALYALQGRVSRTRSLLPILMAAAITLGFVGGSAPNDRQARFQAIGVVVAGRGFSLTVAGTVEPSLRKRFGAQHSEWVYEVFLPEGTDGVQVAVDRWQLPGLTVAVSTELAEMCTERSSNHLRLIYPVSDDRQIVRFALTLAKE